MFGKRVSWGDLVGLCIEKDVYATDLSDGPPVLGVSASSSVSWRGRLEPYKLCEVFEQVLWSRIHDSEPIDPGRQGGY
jgi:hypothetical protein